MVHCSPCPGGEIGRRTVFRSQRSQGCAGSTPVLGTIKKSRTLCGIFCLDTRRACWPKQTNKKSNGERSEPDFFNRSPLVGRIGSAQLIHHLSKAFKSQAQVLNMYRDIFHILQLVQLIFCEFYMFLFARPKRNTKRAPDIEASRCREGINMQRLCYCSLRCLALTTFACRYVVDIGRDKKLFTNYKFPIPTYTPNPLVGHQDQRS